MKKYFINLICTAAMILVPAVSFALPVLLGSSSVSGTWTASDGDGRDAEAVFVLDDLGGGNYNMVVTLTNTATAGVSDPSGILTGIMFNSVDDATLNPLSAVLGPTSTVVVNGEMVDGDVTSPANEVGGEWAYNGNLDESEGDDTPLGATQGIGSTGLDGIFGSANGDNLYFADPALHNLQGPENVNGMQYGILGEGGLASQHSGGLDNNSFVQNQIIFTLSGLSGIGDADAYIAGISDFSFHYGTDYVSIPEPATMLFFIGGLIFFGIQKKKFN